MYEVCEIGDGYLDLFPNLLAIAHYRCGRLREALATLAPANTTTFLDHSHANNPVDLALLAMVRARLGQGDAARATLEHVERLMQDPKLAEGRESVENRNFLREAEQLILDHGFPDDPFAP